MKALNFWVTKDCGAEYAHKIQGATLHVCRGERVVLKIEEKDIMKMLTALGINQGSFSDGFYD